MHRANGLSVRLKLTLSYVGFLMLAGSLLLAAVWVFLLRDQPADILVPSLSNLWRAFNPHNFGAKVFGSAAVAVLGFLLAFGVVGGWLLAGRMLAPLTRITGAVRMATSGSLSHRIALDGRRDELRELADAFDSMLARIEAQIAEQQRFSANASHELRTPLAIAQALLDVARADPKRDVDALIERLNVVNARAIALTEALLILSRADQRSFVAEQVDLSLTAEEAAEALLPLAERNRVSIETSGERAPVAGSPVLLLQMITNLVHNAIVHNVSEPGAIWMTIRAHPTFVSLVVESTGETLEHSLVAQLVEPFRRGTERVRAGQAGVGLGLAIVNSIVQAHAGTLALAPRDGGGLRVSIQIPRDNPDLTPDGE